MNQHPMLTAAVDEMITERFLQENTSFSTREALFTAAEIPLDADDEALAAALGSDDFNAFLARNTRFASFDEMLAKANEAWVSRSLFGEEVDMEAVQERLPTENALQQSARDGQ